MKEVKGGFFRRIYAGLIGVLDQKMLLVRDWMNDPETIAIPFYPSMVGQERYMQDFYVNLGEHRSDGGNDIIPRGHIDLPTIFVIPANSVNRYVRAEYEKEQSGLVQTYTANINGIPLSLIFPVDIIVHSMNDVLNISETILDTFFKVQTFDIIYKGLNIPVQVGFPENVTYEKTISYGFGDETEKHIKFDLQVETYLPSLDFTTELFRGSVMTNITNNIQEDIERPTVNINLDKHLPRG